MTDQKPDEPYLTVYRLSEGQQIECPACGGWLTPRLHLANGDSGACQAGCSKDWQRRLPHLRWHCDRCGWGPISACTEPMSPMSPVTGVPIRPNPEDIPF